MNQTLPGMKTSYFGQVSRTVVILATLLIGGVFVAPKAFATTGIHVNNISIVKSTATADGTFEHGWSWVFDVTVPRNEPILDMQFGDWTSNLGIIPAGSNIRFYSAQSSNASTTDSAILITASSTYAGPMYLSPDSGEGSTRNIQITVDVRVPVGSAGGSYSTTYGLRSNPFIDTVGPVVDPKKDIQAEATSTAGAEVTFDLPLATDLVDGPREVSCVPPSGSIFPMGDTTVVCSATDTSGNVGSSTFVVTVKDTTIPVITLNGPADLTMTVGNDYTDAGATALDNIDGNITSSIIMTGSVATTTVGDYVLTYNVSDSAGNAATPVTRTVHVVASTVVYVTSIDAIPDINVPVGTKPKYASLPEHITLHFSDGSSAVGNLAGSWSTTPPIGELTPINVAGTYPYVGDPALPAGVTNPGALQAHVNLVVYVPQTPPKLSFPTGFTLYDYENPLTFAPALKATDYLGASVPVVCDYASPYSFPVGVTTVSCTATDSGGRSSSGTFTVTVTSTVPRNLDSVDSIPDIHVEYGTALGSAGLPTTVIGHLSDGSTTSLAVAWDGGTPVYDGNTANTYAFSGTVTLPYAVTNTGSVKASANVIVATLEATVISVDPIEEYHVPLGTTEKYSMRTDHAWLNLSNGSHKSAPVTWGVGTPPYNGNVPGSYFFAGTISLSLLPGVTNPLGLMAYATTTVDAPVIPQVVLPTKVPPTFIAMPSAMGFSLSEMPARAFGPAGAQDYLGASVPVSCDYTAPYSFPVGVTTVTCTATDTYGQTTTGSFPITVTE